MADHIVEFLTTSEGGFLQIFVVPVQGIVIERGGGEFLDHLPRHNDRRSGELPAHVYIGVGEFVVCVVRHFFNIPRSPKNPKILG